MRRAVFALLLMWTGLCGAQAVSAFAQADLTLGERLLAEHQCAACHQRQVGGDGSAIYRPAGRINSPQALLGMVERCSTQLNLSLFPEEIASIAAVLDRDHYHFRRGPTR